MALNKKGQAALTDALYFLLIVSVLCTMLFFYAANYGSTIEDKVGKQYWNEYATSALETILYSSTPRIAGQSLEEALEIDYLLAAVKEDFADDDEIDETEGVLVQNISGIMQPLAQSFDYLFYLYLSEGGGEFIFVMIYAREAPKISEGDVEPGMVGIYLCKPETLNDLQNLVESVGDSAKSRARIQLVQFDERDIASYPPVEANLTMWIPTPIGRHLEELNCQLYKEIT